MQNMEPKVNYAILNSIPIDKNLKRYYLSKYRYLAKHNGLKFACDVFSEMRVIAMQYRSDPNRRANYKRYFKAMPVRKNGWLHKLFAYLDSQPHMVLDFLKLYVGMEDPLVSVEQSADAQAAYLESRKIDDSIPSFLRMWTKLIRRKPMTIDEWLSCVTVPVGDRRYDQMAYFRHHSYDEYLNYHRKWRKILFGFRKLEDDLLRNKIVSKEPLPEMYKDFVLDGSHSNTLEADLFDLCGMQVLCDGGWTGEPGPLSPRSLNFINDEILNPSILGLWEEIQFGRLKPSEPLHFLSGEYVGYIQHIPKKGTIKRRPIAVPNRFVQDGMVPIYQVLKHLVRRLPCDATFDQSRFDTKIQNRVNNKNLYIGSVDLSQATDNLPLSWGKFLVEELVLPMYSSSELVDTSWNLFLEASRAKWNNDGIMSRWTVGQPLGSLPSFPLLAVTHNLLLEALSFTNGFGHSPYAVLGDDVVLFNKKLRKQYIRLMTNRGIPLSLHKSYEGNLSEFAGKIYIKGQIPRFVSDQTAIHWNNMFDYQRSTGVIIPFNNLPKAVRKRFTRVVTDNIPDNGNNVLDVYRLCLTAEIDRSNRNFVVEDGLLENYFYQRALHEPQEPDPEYFSGIVNFCGHPITYLKYGYAEKHGFKQRYRKIQLPAWFVRKVRPCCTDTIVQCASIAYKTIKLESI